MQTYRWDDYFSSYMRKLVGIKKYHHFRFTIDSPGVVFVKEFSDSDEIAVNLLKDEPWVPNSRQLQTRYTGLDSLERQQYLFEKVREFCPSDVQDRVYPKPPNVPSYSTVAAEERTTPSPKRQRLCGICCKPCHTRRTCPEQTD